MKHVLISRQELLERYAAGERDFSRVEINGFKARESRRDWEGVNLRGIILRNALLVGIDLNGADLREADFTEAKIREVDIEKANFLTGDKGAKLLAQ